MASATEAGATAPAGALEVRGIRFGVDKSFTASWRFFDLMRRMSAEGADVFDKVDATFELVEMATGVTKEQIVEAAGGDEAKMSDVAEILSEMAKAVVPKN